MAGVHVAPNPMILLSASPRGAGTWGGFCSLGHQALGALHCVRNGLETHLQTSDLSGGDRQCIQVYFLGT